MVGVVIFDNLSRVSEVIGLEALIGFAVSALQVHLHRCLVVLAMLVAVGSLLEELFRFVLPVCLAFSKITEKATF